MNKTILENKVKTINNFVCKAQVNYDLPGLAAGIGNTDGDEYIFVSGNMDESDKTPLEENQIFHMASVSKLFTSTGIMQLHESNEISIENKLVDVLPWFTMADERYKDISIKQMLTHTSGMPDVNGYDWEYPEIDEGALKRYVSSKEVTESKLLWAPGIGDFKYSNMAYETLGSVISEISGMSFEAYINEFIFKPLKMADSTFLTYKRTSAGNILDTNTKEKKEISASLDLDDLKKNNVCMPHNKDENNHIYKQGYYPYNRAHGPSSTLTTNVRDLLKWGQVHLRKEMFSQDTYSLIWDNYSVVPNNKEVLGLGWFKRKQDSYHLFGHEGTDDGFRASFWICPELDVQIVVASNISKAPVKRISKQIFDLLIS